MEEERLDSAMWSAVWGVGRCGLRPSVSGDPIEIRVTLGHMQGDVNYALGLGHSLICLLYTSDAADDL